MFLTLMRRELLANLITFRFVVAMVVTLSLVAANTIVLIADYERRLISYNAAVQQHAQKLVRPGTYSYMEGQILVDRPPNPLSIFNAGLDRRLGNSIHVEHVLVPTLWDTHSHSADNPFLKVVSTPLQLRTFCYYCCSLWCCSQVRSLRSSVLMFKEPP